MDFFNSLTLDLKMLVVAIAALSVAWQVAEQGRKIDVAHRVLLTVIARSPEAVEAALAEAS